MDVYDETGKSVIGVQEVAEEDTPLRYYRSIRKSGLRYEVKKFVENQSKVQHHLI